MEKIASFLDSLELEQHITLEDIPKIDLYMDQVIQLFENKYSITKRNDEEKILTKTMINNYAKGKLLFPIKNKKYSKEHLILISLIYQLKVALSIKDIADTLDGVKQTTKESVSLDDFYQSYLSLSGKNREGFRDEFAERVSEVREEVAGISDDCQQDIERLLLISTLADMSNLYRRAAEKLVDELKG